jgi:asparagine synthase (glutamine-hydrolysing)
VHGDKRAVSDGVGYSWIDTLKEVAKEVSDEQLATKYKFPLQTPTSKEEYYYRSIFTEHFQCDAAACVPRGKCSMQY